jgi:hypothetical protein
MWQPLCGTLLQLCGCGYGGQVSGGGDGPFSPPYPLIFPPSASRFSPRQNVESFSQTRQIRLFPCWVRLSRQPPRPNLKRGESPGRKGRT